ncbi:MAG: hypothetical protein KJ583_00155 [Nanoarchaeota archaeon]|nr:hypothetical protein [Nanoarchaeota archaeon]MBU1269425.1 hypothetical protein [Nanoarchaeota archaeon]MBU1603700.1 hypothetical protein [Nanoarchaeota archaeon]MBU2442937.1 hypothetical protein [Nanoarchaeota archaeon]
MLVTPIDEVLLDNLGKNNFSRLESVLTKSKLELLKHFLGKSKDFFREHHLLSLKNVMDFTKGKKRRTGEDECSHHIYVALKGLKKKHFYNIDDALMFNIKLDHDYVENKVEESVLAENDFKLLIETLSPHYKGLESTSFDEKDKESSDYAIKQAESLLKKAIVGTREDFFNEYKNEHSRIKDHSTSKLTYLEFNSNLVEGVRTITRYAGSDDNYGQYMLRIYPIDIHDVLIHVPPAKWTDVAHNQGTLWPRHLVSNFGLSLEELAEKERFLTELFQDDESKYYKEKELFGEQYKELLQINKSGADWRIRNIEKAIIHIYMGKKFLKAHRNKSMYTEYIKPAFEKMVWSAYIQSARERMFQAVYNPEITIPIKSEIENKWVQYIPKGLNLVEVELSKNESLFKGTINRAITEMMKGEMLSRFFKNKPENISSKELYERTLVYESTLQQNLKRVDLLKDLNIQTIHDLWNMRSPGFYKSNIRKQVRMDYILRNFPKLIKRTTTNQD